VKYENLSSGYVKIAIEAMAIEIVDLPIKNGDFPVRYVSLPEFIQPYLIQRWHASRC
jgi:hypothetical protein